jgi:hypothetical protein
MWTKIVKNQERIVIMEIKTYYYAVTINNHKWYVEDCGWIDEDGKEFLTVADVVKFLTEENAYLTTNYQHCEDIVWYREEDGRFACAGTGETMHRYHLLSGFTDRQEALIYRALKEYGTLV